VWLCSAQLVLFALSPFYLFYLVYWNSITYFLLLPSSAKAQAQLVAELALILISPAPTQQPGLVLKQLEIRKICLEKIVTLSQ
jgi:hypothetical protein